MHGYDLLTAVLAVLEERREEPLLELLADLGGWPMITTTGWNATADHRFQWLDLMARLRLYNNDVLISMWVGPDGKQSTSHIVQARHNDLPSTGRSLNIRRR